MLSREEVNAIRTVGDDRLVRVVLQAHVRHNEQHVSAGTLLWARPVTALELAGDGRARVVWLSPNVPETTPDPSYRPPGPQRPLMWLDAELTEA